MGNERFTALTFSIEQDSLIHGLAGYFTAKLSPSVTLSTLPHEHTPDLVSWFPLYFPIPTPIPVIAGQSLDVSLWRLEGTARVWYEWQVGNMPICNLEGCGYSIGL